MKKIILSLVILFVFIGALFMAATPQVDAATVARNPSCAKDFLGFPVWYRGLTISDSDCSIKSPDNVGGLSGFIWHIVLNIVEDVLMLTGYVAAFFILYGGFQFLTSQGAPDAAAKARTTILNAVIGLVISLASTGIVNFIVTGILK
jgi:hypothetical protein